MFLGANDLIFSLLIVAAPLLSALLQIPGALVVEKLGARKRFFIWFVTPHRTLYILIGSASSGSFHFRQSFSPTALLS